MNNLQASEDLVFSRVLSEQLIFFISSLGNSLYDHFRDIPDFSKCRVFHGNSDRSWTECLSEGKSYTAPLMIGIEANEATKELHLCDIPLLTPRGTFVIAGQERISKKVLKATDISKDRQEKKHLSEAEKTRDLSCYSLVVIDFYKILQGWLLNSIRRETDYYKIIINRLLQGEINEASVIDYDTDFGGFFAGVADSYLTIFKSQFGVENFPFIDSTNPLAEVEHMRKLTFIRGERTKYGRDIHPTHYGRLCVVETPESEKIGMRLHLAHKARIEDGKILTPLCKVSDGSIEFVAPEQDGFLADRLTELKESVLARGVDEGTDDAKYIASSEVKYTDAFDDQLFGYAALQVPFIQHTDPARALMGAKNLKQAVPLKNPEIPIIKTGYEKTVAELSGRIIRAEEEGEVESISNGAVIIKSQSGEKRYPFVHGIPSIMSKTAFMQTPVVKTGEDVTAGQVIIEGSGIKDGELALGANFLVAYMPYYGFNIDDGIVVSQKAADRLKSVHIEEFEIRIQKGDSLIQESLVKEGDRLERIKGSMPRIATVKRMENRKEENISVFAKEEMLGGVIQRRSFDSEKGKITIWVRSERQLEVGDKLMGRHGNKGIVSRIFPVADMPHFKIVVNGKEESRYIDIILNPHSVIARMNLGQIYETHFGWVAKEHPEEAVRIMAEMMGKPFARIDLKELSNWLKESGLDGQGKISMQLSDSQKTINPVVVGYQYIVKLNHLASGKLSVRGEEGPVSYVTDIPLSGKKHEGGQRIGEMEVWALMAHGANEILNDMLGLKSNAYELADNAVSVSESLKVLIYYLRGLGIAFDVFDADERQIEPEDFSNTKKKEIKHYSIRWANDTDIARWGRYWDESLKSGPKNIIKLAELMPDNKEQMGRIELAEAVRLCKMEINNLPVIPMRCRPRQDSKLNILYKRIFLLNSELKELKKKDKSKMEYYNKKKAVLCKTVERLEEEISGLIKGKQGVIRKAILGKRVNLSARAVIVPDPTLSADSALIPQSIMSGLNIKNPEIIKNINGDEIIKAQKVLLSRQPTLHIHNIQAFNALPHNDNAIAIHPLIRKGFNADFDGDTMAVYATDKPIPDGMHVSGNIFLAANGRINLDFSQDIAAGIYYACQINGKAKFEDLINDRNITSKYTTIRNKDIADMLYKYYLKCKDRAKTLRLAEQIAAFGFMYATISGLTFGIFDLQELHLTSQERKNLNFDIENIEKSLEMKLEGKPANPISIMMLSGAKGDIKQLRQMAGIKGVVERLGGKPISASINSSYMEGLRPTEYYLACFGARKSLGDKKLMTPQCGYLTRRLAFSALDMKINEEDCDTNEGVNLDINLSLGRTLLTDIRVNDAIISRNTIIDEENLDRLKMAGIDKIDVRSPLKCKLNKGGLCIKCYGRHLSTRKEVQTGFAAGILSAEVIGERATQDAMRTYHKGEATATIKDFKDIECIFDNAVNPREKKRISEEIKSKDDAFELARKLFDIYEKNVDIKHYEVILRALMAGCEFKGTKRIIADKGILYNASYERAVEMFKASAGQEKMFSPSTVLEKLFK